MAVCLIKEKINDFKKALKIKDIKMEDLFNLGTEDLIKTFEPYAGKNAKDIALLFEQKRILKNKFLGIKNAVSKIGEIGRYDPVKNTQIAEALKEFRERQTERIFNPQESEVFYNALADKIIGTHITEAEAKTIFNFTSKATELKQVHYDPNAGDFGSWKDLQTKGEYGATQFALKRFMSELKGEGAPLKDLLRGKYQEFKTMWNENKYQASFDLIKDSISGINDMFISLVATLDNSFQFRQGMKVLLNPRTSSKWWNGFKNSWIDIGRTLKSKGGKVKTEEILWSDIYSNPNYIEGRYTKMKILPEYEEQFPTEFPERIPIIGRAFSASKEAFVGSALRMRKGVADWSLKLAKDAGHDINDAKILEQIGAMVNSLTARGRWSSRGMGRRNPILWAPKMLKGNIDALTLGMSAPELGGMSSFARTQMAINSLSWIASTAALITLINALKPGTVEINPQSSNFAKPKIGDFPIDITGGAGSIITLVARLITGKYKSATTGVVYEYGNAYGEQSRWDAILNFLENKTTPTARALISILEGEVFGGKPATALNILKGLQPISLQNIEQTKEWNAMSIIANIADILGLSSSINQYEKDWSQNMGVEMTQFKQKVGEQKFKEANDKFNKELSDWLDSVKNNTKFQNLTEDEKQSVITRKKNEIKDKMFKRYGFIYKQQQKKVLPKF